VADLHTARDLEVTGGGERVNVEPGPIVFDEYQPFLWHGGWLTGHRGLCRCEGQHDHEDLVRRHRTRARHRQAERRAAIQRARKRDADFRRRVAAYPDDIPF
jgi:hypothetical protein